MHEFYLLCLLIITYIHKRVSNKRQLYKTIKMCIDNEKSHERKTVDIL